MRAVGRRHDIVVFSSAFLTDGNLGVSLLGIPGVLNIKSINSSFGQLYIALFV